MDKNSVFDLALGAALAAKEAGQPETAQALLDLATALYVTGATDLLSSPHTRSTSQQPPLRPIRQ